MFEESSDLAFYILYGVAYGVSIIAFMMTNIFLLRLLVIISSAAYVVYYYAFPAEPLWLDVIAEFAFVLVNVFMMLFLIWRNARISFDQREEFLYQNEFPELSPIEFRKLLNISVWHLTGPGEQFTIAGQELLYVYYLVSGRAQAQLADGTTANVPLGSVIGEISYRLECPASATVAGTESCMSLRWNQDELRKLCDKTENIKRVVDGVMSSHMARKLSAQTEPQTA